MIEIRLADSRDEASVGALLEPVLRAGDTYTLPADISRRDALDYWCGAAHSTYLATENGAPLGTYYRRTNQQGGGDHVCNCGFVTSTEARGKGIARKMLEHALVAAKDAGYRAMQFNFVVATNTRAIAIWEDYGFDIVGRLPGAFNHPSEGYVDALVMYRNL